MVFGWTQIVMDIQPLIAIVSGEGKLHGFTHTYVGATLIAIFCAATGKHLAQWALVVLSHDTLREINIRWWIAVLSALIGAYSHVVLDSIMHTDITPLSPFSQSNALLGLVSVAALHKFCAYSGLAGAVGYFAAGYLLEKRNRALNADVSRRRAG